MTHVMNAPVPFVDSSSLIYNSLGNTVLLHCIQASADCSIQLVQKPGKSYVRRIEYRITSIARQHTDTGVTKHAVIGC